MKKRIELTTTELSWLESILHDRTEKNRRMYFSVIRKTGENSPMSSLAKLKYANENSLLRKVRGKLPKDNK